MVYVDGMGGVTVIGKENGIDKTSLNSGGSYLLSLNSNALGKGIKPSLPNFG